MRKIQNCAILDQIRPQNGQIRFPWTSIKFESKDFARNTFKYYAICNMQLFPKKLSDNEIAQFFKNLQNSLSVSYDFFGVTLT